MEKQNSHNSHDSRDSHSEYTPVLDGIKIIKVLYKTKGSTIWLAKFDDDQYVVIKGKLKSELSTEEFEFFKREREFLELNINKNLSFPYLIKSARDDNYLYMILNFIEGIPISSLHTDNILKFNQYPIKDNSTIEEFKLKKNLFLHIISRVISHLYTLQKDNYIYRDLKLNNLIINKKLEIFMIDFGFVKRLDGSNSRTSTICGTYHAFAPEMFKTKFDQEYATYSMSIDVYSLGVLIYELFTSNPPFPYLFKTSEEILQNYSKIISEGINDNYFQESFILVRNISVESELFIDNLIGLIKGCMNVNEVERFTLEQVKSHLIFEDNFETYLQNNNLNFDSEYLKNIISSIDFNGEFCDSYEYLVKEVDVFDKYF